MTRLRLILSFSVLAAAPLAPAAAQALHWTRPLGSGPTPRGAQAMCYDSNRGMTVLFGGFIDAGVTPSNETWESDGTVWVRRVVPGPTPRGDHAIAFDKDRLVTVLFGGYNGTTCNNETWIWNGIAWAQPPIFGPIPSARGGHKMAYDTARQVTVLFGGYDANGIKNGETWEWNGTTWTQLPAGPAPSPRGNHAMIYDAARQVTVLFGGNTGTSQNVVANGETWEYAGSWLQRSLGGSPAPREGHAMAFDASRGVGVMFGGYNGNTFNGETWEWNGAGAGAWTQNAIFGPSPRFAHSMVHDVGRGVTVLFGGYDGIVVNGETWELICYANCDASTGTPVLTANDFQCFLNSFAAQSPYANCDGSTGTPALTANDFQCFLNAYAGGCS